MQIIKADILGFCFGVRRAVECAEKAIIENEDKEIYSLGPLIHNENVLSELEQKGLKIIKEEQIENLNCNSVCIIRAHGTNPQIIERLQKTGCSIVDATCPRVKKSQNIVGELSGSVEYVLFTGDKNHSEVKGIEGYGRDNFILIQNKDEAMEFCKKHENEDARILLLSQTTFSSTLFIEISNLLKIYFPNIEIKNTICSATRERQESLLELCGKVEAVLVIGGKTSANSKRLLQIAQVNCRNVAFIQHISDIPENFKGFEKVGITAGASTPDSIIEEIIHFLSC